MRTLHVCLRIALITATALTGCNDRENDASSRVASDSARSPGRGGGGPVIAATIYPLAEVARQLVGDEAKVVCLLPPGQSPHGHELTASSMAQLRRAKLLVKVGLGVDPWANDAARNIEGLSTIEFAHAVNIERKEDDHEHLPDHEHAHAPDHHPHGPINPHIWLDPVLMRRFVGPLAAALADHLPDQATTIEANRAKFVDELDALDADYRAAMADVPRGRLVTFHDAFDHLAKRYGLTVDATLISTQAPAAGVTMAGLEQTITAIREHDIRVIFTEPQFAPDAVRRLEQQTGVRALMLDPLGDPYSDNRAGYIPMMRYNLGQLVEGLGKAKDE